MNENYSKYKLIVQYDPDNFQDALNNAIKDGWVRAEPMHLATGQYDNVYSQLLGMPRGHQPKADEESNTKKEFINHDHD